MARPRRNWTLEEHFALSAKAREAAARLAPRLKRAPERITGGLVLLDSRKLRAQAIKAVQKAEQAFHQLDQVLKNFEGRDVRSFEQWKHERLGPQLADMARLAQALVEAEYHLAMADEESRRTGQPLWRAFQAWQQREERRRLHPEFAEPEPDAEDERDPFAELKRAMADELGVDPADLSFEGFDEDETPPPRRSSGRPPKEQKDVQSALRTRYRQLCRLLHPDAAGEMSPERRAIWHQVQEAYAARDTARLDLLLARLEQGEGLERTPRTISELRAMAQKLRRSLQELRTFLADARRHPAWRFGDRDAAERAQMERAFRRDMVEDQRQMERRLAQIRAALQPRTKRRPTSSPGPRDAFLF